MNELTQSDLDAARRAMAAADRMERLAALSRIGWTMAISAVLGILFLAGVAVLLKKQAGVDLLADNGYSCVTCSAHSTPTPTPTPSPTPVDVWGTEASRFVVSAHPENTIEKIVAAAELCGVAPGVAIRLAARESGLRHRNANGRVLKSPAGAYGIFQVRRIAAREISPTLRVENEWENMLAGLCLLRKYHDRTGSWHAALLDYVAGPNRKLTLPSSVIYANGILQGEAQ